MANLLDMLLGDQSNLFNLVSQRQGQPSGGGGGSTPSRPSVSPAAPSPSPSPAPSGGGGGGGVSGAIGSLFGGGTDPRLSREDNRAIQKQAALKAGITMMASAWGSMPNPGATIMAGLAVGSEDAKVPRFPSSSPHPRPVWTASLLP